VLHIIPILREIELFSSLQDEDLHLIAEICQERTYHKGDIISSQGELGNEVLIITQGYVEILVDDRRDPLIKRIVANLGEGQIIGEMGLVDQGTRSATVRAIDEPTFVQVIEYKDLKQLCENNTKIGYIIMKNLAADISFKLRHANILSG